ncbi:LuxR C-terminal-related transcriptional regulator [Variovorax sp. RCC_210]|uniref:LuxR C-terminal-related transcriptional regulator n=1 Tax=Variovorax sp. RCC_210 TaxID=3239217 RepID=UPI0035237800
MQAPVAYKASYGGAFHGALIVEQDIAMGERMRRILSELAPGRRVVIASSRAEACNLLAALPYDLVLIDMRLPQDDGVSLINHVRQAYPWIESVAMSAADDHQLVDAAIAAGAVGYLLTEADDAELAFLLRSIERGGAPMDSRVARRLLGRIAASAKPSSIAPVVTRPSVARPAPGPLSPRELKVLRLIAQGWSNREIADAVFLSINTVEFHAKSIYRKLSVKSRTQAVHEATQHGLLN